MYDACIDRSFFSCVVFDGYDKQFQVSRNLGGV